MIRVQKKKLQKMNKRIRDELLELIQHRLRPGDLLPSQAELCRRYQVSPSPVFGAIKALEEEGWVVRKHGSGTYVTDRRAPALAVLCGSRGSMFDLTCTLCQQAFKDDVADGTFQYRVHGSHIERPDAETLVRDGVRGVITMSLGIPDYIRSLRERGIAVTCTDWLSPIPGVDHVGMDSFGAGELAAEWLMDAGFRRIGYLGLQPWDLTSKCFRVEVDSEQRKAGVMSALRNRGIKPQPRDFLDIRHEVPHEKRTGTFSYRRACRALFEDKRSDPLGLAIFSQDVKSKLLAELKGDAKRRARPGLVTFEYLEQRTDESLPLVGCALQSVLRQAADILMARIADPSRTECRVMLQPTLVEL